MARFHLVRHKMTIVILHLLFSLHGLPVFPSPKRFLWKFVFVVLRVNMIFFANSFLVYRIYRGLTQNELKYDVLPLINAGVCAGVVNSIVIHYGKFLAFSKYIHEALRKYDVCLSNHMFLRIGTLCSFFVCYILSCAIMFPFNASHWLDAATHNMTSDFLHGKAALPYTHTAIVVMGAGTLVTNIVLYCFVCSVLRAVVRSIYVDLRALNSKEFLSSSCIQAFGIRFAEAAKTIASADDVFSLFGFVCLASVFARACAYIHFYLSMNWTVWDSSIWVYILVQVSFDFCALTAISYYSSAVSEEAKKLGPLVFHISQQNPPRNINFHLQCLNFAKLVVSSNVLLSAWKMFPFTRKLLPTVIGVTLSYVIVIVQMYHAATSQNCNNNTFSNETSNSSTTETYFESDTYTNV